MKVTVKNLGVIKEGSVDLDKNLIVFCGMNNSGKTAMSYFLYSLTKSRSVGGYTFEHTEKKSPSSIVYTFNLADCFEQIKTNYNNKFREFYDRLISRKIINYQYIDKSFFFDLNFDFQNLNPTNILLSYNRDYTAQIGIETQYDLHVTKLEGSGEISYEIITSEGGKIIDINAAFFHFDIQNIIEKELFRKQLPSPVRFLVAERSGLNIFSKAAALASIGERKSFSDQTEGRPTSPNQKEDRYNFVLTDNIRLAEDLLQQSQSSSVFVSLAEQLEDLIDGTIHVSEYGEMQYLMNSQNEISLDMQSSSSSVKSLADIIFYFKHLARIDSTLFIDEPELNLHPSLQRKLAKILVQAVNEGVKVIMSTHSDHIIRELNNMIMLSKDDENAISLRKKYGYNQNQVIRPEKVGCYVFKDRTIFKEEVTEIGIEIKSIDEEIHSLNVSSSEIYSTLYDN